MKSFQNVWQPKVANNGTGMTKIAIASPSRVKSVISDTKRITAYNSATTAFVAEKRPKKANTGTRTGTGQIKMTLRKFVASLSVAMWTSL